MRMSWKEWQGQQRIAGLGWSSFRAYIQMGNGKATEEYQVSAKQQIYDMS